MLCSSDDAVCMGSGCGPCFCCSSPLCWCPQFQILRKLSQEPVATAMPSAVTPRQLTLLSWPERIPVVGKKRGQGVKGGLGEVTGLTLLRTHIAGCAYTPCLALSVPAQPATVTTQLRTSVHGVQPPPTGLAKEFLGRYGWLNPHTTAFTLEWW